MRGNCHFLEPDHVQPKLHSLPLPQPLNLESFSHVQILHVHGPQGNQVGEESYKEAFTADRCFSVMNEG